MGFPEATIHDRLGDGFCTTQWTDLFQAKNPRDTREGNAGLSRVCEKYWRPIYAFLRRGGCSQADAEDLTQGFFEHVLSKDWLKNVEPERGKFRSYLLKAVKNFHANARAKNQAEKRGGEALILSLDEINLEEEALLRSATLTPEQVFEKRWAEGLMARAILRLEKEYQESGKKDLFNALKNLDGASSYSVVAMRLGLSEGALKTAAHRLRARLANIVRSEIAETVRDRNGIQQELYSLREALSR